MTIQLIFLAYFLAFLGIIYLVWSQFLNVSKPVSKNELNEEIQDEKIKGKKVVIDGELDGYRENTIKNDLLKKQAILEDKMTENTEFLITGKNPDWLVVEEAKDLGVTIVNEMDWQQNNVTLTTSRLSKMKNKSKKKMGKQDAAQII